MLLRCSAAGGFLLLPVVIMALCLCQSSLANNNTMQVQTNTTLGFMETVETGLAISNILMFKLRANETSNEPEADIILILGRLWGCYFSVFGIAMLVALACAIVVPCVFRCLLCACGFRGIGVRGGSYAADYQSVHGTPCCFREAQSVSMRRSGLATFSILGFVGGIVLGCYVAYSAYFKLPICNNVNFPFHALVNSTTSVNSTVG